MLGCVALPVVLLFLIAFVMSCWWKSKWHKRMFGCGLGTLLLLAAYLIFQAPKTRCNPDIMAKHYEKHKTEMEEFCGYMQSVLPDSTDITLEFKWDRPIMFHVTNANGSVFSWDEESRMKRDSLMVMAGLTKDEYDGIRQRLKSMGCIGVEASRISPDTTKDLCKSSYSTPTTETTTIWFRRITMGMYSFILSARPFTDEEKEEALSDPMIIPYNDHVLFLYGGGAIGMQDFPKDVKDKYLEKHKPW